AKDVPSVDMKSMGPGDARKVVDVSIGGKTWQALIDSGAPHTVIDLAAARSIGFDPDAAGAAIVPTGGIGKHAKQDWVMKVPALELGPERITNFVLKVEDLYGAIVADVHTMVAGSWADEQ